MNPSNIRVYKIGGADLDCAEKYHHFSDNITKTFIPSYGNLIVCSATRGSTRVLIAACEAKKSGNAKLVDEKLIEFYDIHSKIMNDLFGPYVHRDNFNRVMKELENALHAPYKTEDEFDGKVLKFGELFSSAILCLHLRSKRIKNIWKDSRPYIQTNMIDGKSTILEFLSEALISRDFPRFFNCCPNVCVPGYIGYNFFYQHDSVLPLNGSDTTAAFYAYALNASSLSYFKETKGVWKEDKPLGDNPEIVGKMRYSEYIDRFQDKDFYPVAVDAIRIAARKRIPILVKSYMDLADPGTLIY